MSRALSTHSGKPVMITFGVLPGSVSRTARYAPVWSFSLEIIWPLGPINLDISRESISITSVTLPTTERSPSTIARTILRHFSTLAGGPTISTFAGSFLSRTPTLWTPVFVFKALMFLP